VSRVRSLCNKNKANIENEISWDEIIDSIDDDSLNGVKIAYHSELDKRGIDLIFIIMQSITGIMVATMRVYLLLPTLEWFYQ
jgi:hypothetical protein